MKFLCESCHEEYSTKEYNLTDCHEHMCDLCFVEYSNYNELTKMQKELFVEMFVKTELDILESYTQEELQDILGEEIPELVDGSITNWKDIEQYLRDIASEYETVGQIQCDFDAEYDEIFV